MDYSHILSELIILACGAFCSFVVFKLKKRDDQKEKEHLEAMERKEKEEIKQAEARQAIKDALEDISKRLGVIEKDQAHSHQQIKELVEKNEKLEGVNLASLRDRLLQAFRYFIEKEKAPALARENLDMMVKAYESLGGNGFIHDMYEQFKLLPIDKQNIC